MNAVKNEFRDLGLKSKIKADDQYMVNLIEVTPVKHQLVSDNYEQAVVVNRVACGDARDQKENLDRDFGHMWQATLWGGQVPKKIPDDVYRPYKTGRSSEKSNRPKSAKSAKSAKGKK